MTAAELATIALVLGLGAMLQTAVGFGMAPITWAGSHLGRSASARWDRRRLQLVASLVLYAIALSNLVGPWLGGS